MFFSEKNNLAPFLKQTTTTNTTTNPTSLPLQWRQGEWSQ